MVVLFSGNASLPQKRVIVVALFIPGGSVSVKVLLFGLSAAPLVVTKVLDPVLAMMGFKGKAHFHPFSGWVYIG